MNSRWQEVGLSSGRLWVLALMIVALATPFLTPARAAHAAELQRGIHAPTFEWETVHNPGFLDSGRDIVVDSGGYSYVLAQSYHEDNDITILKLSPTGAVLWTVDIIGESLDFGEGIALDGAGDVFVAGWTDSVDFPLVDPLQGTLVGFRDAFVTKLSSVDGTILYSTFLGGDYVDEAHDVVIGGSGEIILVGQTESSDFPVVDPIQGELNGPPYAYSDAFITKLSADGSTILYSTYLGGSNDERWTRVALGNDGTIYIAGSTESTDFPTVAPIQSANAGQGDLFVARIAPDGSALEYSTYLGGEDFELAGRIAVDGSGQAYVAGSTQSYTFPTTAGAFQEQFVGDDCSSPPFQYRNCYDAFVTKVSADGSAWAYSSYLGGSLDDEVRGLVVDGSGDAHLVGYTFSSDFPGAGANTGIFASELSADGSDLLYTVTKWSGSMNAGHGIALDSAENIYITGAINVPADVYVAKLTLDEPPPEDSLHVDDIRLRVIERNGRYQLQALVTVKDQNGQRVSGADVAADVTVPPDRTRARTAMTNAQGRASFRGASGVGGMWQVCVTGITKAGYVYDPDQNQEACDALVYP